MCRLECENLSNQHDFMKKKSFLFIDFLFLDLNRFGRVYFKRFFLTFAAFVYYLRERSMCTTINRYNQHSIEFNGSIVFFSTIIRIFIYEIYFKNQSNNVYFWGFW